MSEQPDIILSSLDVDRLEALLERQSADSENAALLEAELSRGTIVQPQDVPADVVTMNSTVVFEVQESGQTFTRTLVYPHDQVSTENSISILAPVGSALLGLRAGQTIEWPMQHGVRHVTITQVISQPERDGDLQR